MLPDFFKNANGILLGFEVHRIQSFQNLGKWITMFKLSQSQTPIVLVGTKLDLGYHPTLTREMVMNYVSEFNLVGYAETSAKENINVELPFRKILEHIKGFQPGTVPIGFLSEKDQQRTVEWPVESPVKHSASTAILEVPAAGSLPVPQVLSQESPPISKLPPSNLSSPQIHEDKFNSALDFLSTFDSGKPPEPQATPLEQPIENARNIIEISQTDSHLTRCPHCNSPFRESQIQLRRVGRKVICHNCLKIV